MKRLQERNMIWTDRNKLWSGTRSRRKLKTLEMPQSVVSKRLRGIDGRRTSWSSAWMKLKECYDLCVSRIYRVK